jgi:catechol 2,3-dioxygenase-like lactoylglutathione lyase family enzyme
MQTQLESSMTKGSFAWLIALGILVSSHGISPEPLPSAKPTFAAQGAFVALVVTNLDASLDWYESNLDLHLVKRGKSSRVAAETAVLGGHNMFVELIHYTDRSLAKREVNDSAPVAGPVKAGAILDPTGFDLLAKQIHSHGIEARSFEDKEMGCRTFIVRNGDDNLIQFFTQTD